MEDIRVLEELAAAARNDKESKWFDVVNAEQIAFVESVIDIEPREPRRVGGGQ